MLQKPPPIGVYKAVFMCYIFVTALVVQWIGHKLAELVM